ncbi:MFS transporter [Nonomuraea soli]|uniref:MFS family permease n=1 Tax=Nonomuraea soli TaxID=1032476 RepID=A0A7W0HR47_9ACTN|nr:MFS transporter [Nonomuraea soli]MBA2892570.1 MFS family permease [Nonomuraea soli]
MATTDPLAPSALAEPERPVRGGWIAAWTAALFGMYAAYYGIAQIVLPKQADELFGDSGKVPQIAWATGVSALVTVVVVLLVGMLSDRTTAARGRRQVWVLAGAVVAALALAGQGLVTGALAFVAVWGLANAGISAMTAALSAAVPDEVPVNQRAFVSAFMGISVSAGPLVGVALVALVVTDVLPGYLALAGLLLLLALPYSLGTRGTRLHPHERPRASAGDFLRGIVAPLRHADFAWAWSGRFFIQLSNALAQVFLFYYLQDFLKYPDPEIGTFILTAIYAAGVCAVAVPAGRISDRTLKRKRMVWIASALQGATGLIFGFVPVFEATMVGALLLGIGYGAYAAVDQALITQVLPRPEDRGKDLGVIGIANVLPYAATGLIGGIVIEAFGYPALMVLVLVTGLIAAATVAPIKSVR